MIIERNERRGTWRLSHLQENAENDAEEFKPGNKGGLCQDAAAACLAAAGWAIITQHDVLL